MRVHSISLDTYLVPSPVLVLEHSEDIRKVSPPNSSKLVRKRRSCRRGNAMGAEPYRKNTNLPGKGEMK